MEENTTYKPFAYVDQYIPTEGETVYYNTEKTLTVRKNDCSVIAKGNPVTLTAGANKFISKISLADANQQADSWLSANVQANANNIGACGLRPTAWRGANFSCVIEQSTTLLPFDYMLIKYKWALGAGKDLDTLTGLVNTGIAALDNKWMGYNFGNELPINSSAQDSHIMWGGDVTDLTGQETCLINLKKLKENYSDFNNMQIRMAGIWYNSQVSGVIDFEQTNVTGNIDVEITTYSGGTVTKIGKEIFNNGGTLIQQLNFSKNINIQGSSTNLSIDQLNHIGYINYSKTLSTGEVVITY